MSLINKMLVDLEARKDGAAALQPIYDDLRPAVSGHGTSAFARYRVAIMAAGAGAVLVAGYAMYASQSVVSAPVASVVAKPTPREIAAAPTLVASAPVSTPTPVVSEPAPAITAPVAAQTAAPVASEPTLAATVPTATAPAANAEPLARNVPAVAVAPKADAMISAPTPVAPAVPTARVKPVPVASARPAASKRAPIARPIAFAETPSDIKIEKTARTLTPRERALDLHRTALAQRQRGDRGAAEASLRAALVQDAGLISARMALVNLQLESGRSSEAIALLQDGLNRAPAHYAFAQLAARLYVEQGNEAHALAMLEANRVHAARDADYLGFLATLYQRAQRYAAAATAYDAALALRPQEARWWVGSGIVREAQGDWVGAESAYARAQGNPALPAALTRFVHERLTALKARS